MPFAPLASAYARRVVGAAAAGGVLALVLVGCMGAPEATPTPVSTETAAEPIFASDEEALAAAEQAYKRFGELSDKLSADPTADTSVIESALTPAYFPEFVESLTEFRSSGLSTSGGVTFTDFNLAENAVDPDGIAAVQIYACADYSSYRFLNSAGSDVTPTERPLEVTMLVQLRGTEAASKMLVVDSTEPWDGSAGC